jgi:hypothetical protein
MKEALRTLSLNEASNTVDLVLFGGDLNWNDKMDGNPLVSTAGSGQSSLKQMFAAGGSGGGGGGGSSSGGGSGGSSNGSAGSGGQRLGDWADGWLTVHGKSNVGYTYDGPNNDMLDNYLKGRFDRIFVRARRSAGSNGSNGSNGGSGGGGDSGKGDDGGGDDDSDINSAGTRSKRPKCEHGGR